ncbi:MAG: beta-eliminating lyase-related protein [Myxococcaceae bacterium]|nr:beta-eliminating lyase-related protein [Myxococcaceae bacterium]MCI0668992.1 beta-eliminating lyase-related protein [Myxococcaceae bacterium]
MNPPRTIDLRSDTVTRPTASMRRAMAEAEVGDDVYGEDPTVRRLEEAVAARLGTEAALFVPSGTMANQLAVGIHCRRADELIAEAGSHCIHYETGAVAALWGVQVCPVQGQQGLLTPAQVAPALRAPADWNPRSRLLWLENTHNRGGGTVWPAAQLGAVVAEGRRLGLAVHLDGARLFNAEAASGVRVAELARGVDTVSVCFSKGLGAPVGSALCGSRAHMAEARRLRKMLGGGMRQAGILAAAALHALEHHVERLADDHRNARLLAEGLAGIRGVEVDLARVQSNMVFATFPRDAEEVCRHLARAGVLAGPAGSGPNVVRFVLHLDIATADVHDVTQRISLVARELTA